MLYEESEVYSMIKNKDEIIKEKSKQVTSKLREYINGFDALSDTTNFTIDNIETMMGKLENETRQIYAQTNDEMIQQISDKDLILKKKENIMKKG